MLALGYGSQVAVAACKKQITDLIADFKPSIVLADYAPIASLVARSMGIPIIQIGNGYCTPPINNQGPHWLPFQTPTEKESSLEHAIKSSAIHAGLSLEKCLNSVFAEYAQINGRLRFSDLISNGKKRLIVCEPEFDPYKNARNFDHARHVGFTKLPTISRRLIDEVSLDFTNAGKKLRVLAYLKQNTEGFNEYLKQLSNIPDAMTVVLGSSAPLAQLIGRANIAFVSNPIDLESAFEVTDLFITNGGLHSLSRAITFGKPTVIVPSQAEQAATAILFRDHPLVRICPAAVNISAAVKSAALAILTPVLSPNVTVTSITAEDQIAAEIQCIIDS